MDVRKIGLLTGALVIAVTTALLARALFASSNTNAVQAIAAPALPKGPKILVATRALPVGTILTADSIRFQQWPADLIANAYFKEDGAENIDALVGRVVRNAITAGQPLTQGALVKPGERGFLAAALGPGMRAMTVAVSAESGVAGFVFPGDRVDIVLTQNAPVNGVDLKASETIVRNVRVLAADQRTSQTDDKGQVIAQISQTVTLEVTPKIGEKISLAQSLGKLSLLLRSLSDGGAEVDEAIASGRLRLPPNIDPRAERQRLADVAARPNDSRPTVSTGADVSQFFRTSANSAIAAARSARAAPTAPSAASASPLPAAAARAPSVRIWRDGGTEIVSLSGSGQ